MPSDREIREERRRAIMSILKEGTAIVSQAQLVDMLRGKGIEATQSSVSRDLRDLEVYRFGRFYEISGKEHEPESVTVDLEERAARFLRELRTAGPNLVIALTYPGAAQTLAVALDIVEWKEIVGTMAGDDTIFIATPGAAEQRRLIDRLNKLIER